MFSSQISHPKVVEGFHLPSSNPAVIPGSTSESSSSHHLYPAHSSAFVDPSFIFTNSQQGHLPSPYNHSFSSSSKPGTLSDLDLFDDASYAALVNGSYSQNNGPNGFDPSSFNLSLEAPYGSSSNNKANPRQADSFALHQFLSSNNISSPTSRSPASAAAFVSPRSPAAQESPNGNHNGSYSSVGESFPSPVPASATVTTSTTKRRPSPPEAGRQSRSTGVGKAPSSTTRSRSARRGSAASVGAGYAATAQQAVGIPSPSATSPGSPQPTHSLAISMPAYSNMMGSGGANNGGGVSAGGQSWFSNGSLAYSAGGDTDETGWRPSGVGGIPSSAPVLGSKSKSKTGLDDVLEDPGQKQAALLTEKRRRRRESHNAVERRRRDNINDRITDLAALLPECLLDQVNSKNEDDDGGESPVVGGMGLPVPGLGTSPGMGVGNVVVPASAERQAMASGKPNKGIVLAKSVEYIRYLQQLVELHTQRNTELERLVSELRITSQGDPRQLEMQAEYNSNSADSPGGMAFSPGSAGEDDSYHPLGADWAMGMRLKEESDDDEMRD